MHTDSIARLVEHSEPISRGDRNHKKLTSSQKVSEIYFRGRGAWGLVTPFKKQTGLKQGKVSYI